MDMVSSTDGRDDLIDAPDANESHTDKKARTVDDEQPIVYTTCEPALAVHSETGPTPLGQDDHAHVDMQVSPTIAKVEQPVVAVAKPDAPFVPKVVTLERIFDVLSPVIEFRNERKPFMSQGVSFWSHNWGGKTFKVRRATLTSDLTNTKYGFTLRVVPQNAAASDVGCMIDSIVQPLMQRVKDDKSTYSPFCEEGVHLKFKLKTTPGAQKKRPMSDQQQQDKADTWTMVEPIKIPIPVTDENGEQMQDLMCLPKGSVVSFIATIGTCYDGNNHNGIKMEVSHIMVHEFGIDTQNELLED